MDILEFIKLFLIPVAVLVTGYQFKLQSDMSRRIKDLEAELITEEGVRVLIADKSEVLHLADKEQQARLDRLELYISKIDYKLDKIIDNLMTK